MRARILKLSAAAAIVTASLSSSARAQLVGYNGGYVMSHVQLVVVFWGAKVNPVLTSSTTGVGPFFQALTDSQYMDWLDEYYMPNSPAAMVNDPIGRGTLYGPVTITPGNKSTSLTDASIGTELATQINNNVLPAPGANVLYMVFFPPGYSIESQGAPSCSYWCGDHTSEVEHVKGRNVPLSMAFIPDMAPNGPCGTCGPLTQFQNETVTASHEMTEAITDPLWNSTSGGSAWFTEGVTEIGDPCQYEEIGNAALGAFLDNRGFQYWAQQLYSDSDAQCSTGFGFPKCQQTSQTFGISPGGHWGFAPAEVQAWYSGNQCNTSPASGYPVKLCQNASDIYGIQPGNNSYAPTSVVNWFVTAGCQTSPLVFKVPCQRASDTYGITANVTWGSAPSYVQTWWEQTGCGTAANAISPCQKVANIYGITDTSWGFAPSDVQSAFYSAECFDFAQATDSIPTVCQNAANMYGIVNNVTWGDAPASVQAWWTASGCSGGPQCQGISNLLGTTANVNWGLATSAVRSFWSSTGCNTVPQFGPGDWCQTVSDNFGAITYNGETLYELLPSFGQAPWYDYCSGKNYMPKNDDLRQYTMGPYGE